MAIGAIFLWSFVYNIIRISSGVGTSQDAEDGSFEETKMLLPEDCTEGPTSTKDSSIHDHLEDQYMQSSTLAEELIEKPKVPFSSKLKGFMNIILSKVDLKKLLAPSTIAVIIGFIVGIIPLLRKALIGNSAPLRMIQESASLLSGGAIPTVSLIVGANLLRGLRGSEVKFSLMTGIIIVRYIALPLLGIAIVKCAIRLSLVSSSDTLYQFVLLLQYALPPAVNIGTITQLFGAGESECSVIMLWTYALASVSLTLWSTIYMWLVS